MAEQAVETLESLPDDDGFQKLWKTLQPDATLSGLFFCYSL